MIAVSLKRMFSSLMYPSRYTFMDVRTGRGWAMTPYAPSEPYMMWTRSARKSITARSCSITITCLRALSSWMTSAISSRW